MIPTFDLAIIGGGINGVGIARDAAGRGLSVLLAEQGDLAQGTSSASTKLIHGGLRYLEQYHFRMVREALREREILLRMAPHIVWPLRFVLPHHPGLRPWPLVRLGLFLYDHLGGRRILPPTHTLDLRQDPAGVPLKPAHRRGFEYSDCWVDDSRLVVLNARDAASRSADIRTRTRCLAAERLADRWRLNLLDRTRRESTIHARAVVNAAGPWVSGVLSGILGQNAPDAIRLVKGSHIVVPRLFAHDRGYIFQNGDGRICFALPFEEDFTLIGTTDEDFAGDPADVEISAAEEAYLLSAINQYLKLPVRREDIVWRYAGVRPLRDDRREDARTTAAQKAPRDYVLEMDAPFGRPPALSVFGGKITVYRQLAEAALAQLAPFFPAMAGPWTARSHLPGGAFSWDGALALEGDLQLRYPFLPPTLLRRLIRSYGTEIPAMLGQARTLTDLGHNFGGGLHEIEVGWLIRNEWACTAEDVLWRRSKLGLRLSTAEQLALADRMATVSPSTANR